VRVRSIAVVLCLAIVGCGSGDDKKPASGAPADQTSLPRVAGAAPAPAEACGPTDTDRTEYDVVLTAVGPGKINVAKVIKEKLGMTLREALALIGSAPVTVHAKQPCAHALELKTQLEEAGATAELR
jgi:large subunit ribosomal protein L7/L12